MWYAKLAYRRLGASVQAQRLGASVEVDERGGQPSKFWQQTVVDPISVQDAISTAQARILSLDDTFSVEDSTASGRGLQATAADTVETSDGLTLEIEPKLASTVTVLDSVNLILPESSTESIADTLATNDSLRMDVERAFPDTLTVNDSTAWALTRVRELADTLTLSDALSLELTTAREDTVTVDDAVVKTMTLIIQGAGQSYIDPGYFATDYVEAADSGQIITVTDSIT